MFIYIKFKGVVNLNKKFSRLKYILPKLECKQNIFFYYWNFKKVSMQVA